MTKANTGEIYLDHYSLKYQSVKNANSKNIFTLFNELSIYLIKEYGIVSFIIPEGFLKTRSYDDCVQAMNKKGSIYKAVYFENWVFEDATTGSVIFEYTKKKTSSQMFEEFLMKKNREIIRVEQNKNPIIERYNKLEFPLLSDISDSFKGMAVQNREHFISTQKGELPDVFLLGNCIDRYFFKNEFYCDYNKLTIVGGTKKLEKHQIYPRILIRRTGNYLCCVLLEHPALTESTLYSCSLKNDKINIKYLLGVLNSSTLTYIVRQKMITNEQAFPQIMMTDLQLLKIPIVSHELQNQVMNKVEKILKYFQKMNSFILKFGNYFSSNYHLAKLTGKLEKWYELDFVDFIKELNKAIKVAKGTSLTKKDEFEWMDLFEENKKKALELKMQIDKTDKEIDQMVYQLYGLTEEEIKIVENS